MSKLPIPAVEARKELEEYLKNNPQLRPFQQRIEQSLILIGDNPLRRFEFLLELTIGHLELLHRSINEMKKDYGIEER